MRSTVAMPLDMTHPTSWSLGDGWLLLTGSLFTGELHRPVGTQVSASDIDFLWLSRRPMPAKSSIQEVSRNLARLCRVRGFHHTSVKWLTPHRYSSWPPWMTNAWLPAVQWHVHLKPEILEFVPPWAATFRALDSKTLTESIDLAWTYAALTLCSTRNHAATNLAISKLLLLLANIYAQCDAILPTSYSHSLRHLISTYDDLQSSAQCCYRVKTGDVDVLSASIKETILIDLDWLSDRLLSNTSRSHRESSRTLRRVMLDMLQSERPPGGMLRAVATEIRIRAARLPSWEMSKRAKYEQAAFAYERGNYNGIQ